MKMNYYFKLSGPLPRLKKSDVLQRELPRTIAMNITEIANGDFRRWRIRRCDTNRVSIPSRPPLETTGAISVRALPLSAMITAKSLLIQFAPVTTVVGLNDRLQPSPIRWYPPSLDASLQRFQTSEETADLRHRRHRTHPGIVLTTDGSLTEDVMTGNLTTCQKLGVYPRILQSKTICTIKLLMYYVNLANPTS